MRKPRMRNVENKELELILCVERQKQEIERLKREIHRQHGLENELRSIIESNNEVIRRLRNNPSSPAWHAPATTRTVQTVDTSGTSGSYWP